MGYMRQYSHRDQEIGTQNGIMRQSLPRDQEIGRQNEIYEAIFT